MTLDAGQTGQGLLIISGDLALTTGFQWLGVILVGGRITVLGTPNDPWGRRHRSRRQARLCDHREQYRDNRHRQHHRAVQLLLRRQRARPLCAPAAGRRMPGPTAGRRTERFPPHFTTDHDDVIARLPGPCGSLDLPVRGGLLRSAHQHGAAVGGDRRAGARGESPLRPEDQEDGTSPTATWGWRWRTSCSC